MSRSPDSPAEDSPAGYLAAWQATLRLLRQGKSWSGHERGCALLNVSGSEAGVRPRFANVSAVTGLDFADDGRGLATVDWDGDGDLDLWLANRTGPRLRLMINRGARDHSSVALRLRGTRSNRDAVGARVTVTLAGGPHAGRPLARTLYAGDGFLSQSSKWLHFGLGREAEIERVTVRWPSRRRHAGEEGGGAERFAGVHGGGRYLLVEGSGQAVAMAPRRGVTLEPSAQESPPPTPSERAVLPVKLPMPRLRYAGFENPEVEVEVAPGPLLVNVWATWCLPCIAELEDLTAHRQQFDAAGLDVLALSVDGLAQDRTTTPDDAESLLLRLGFPFGAGLATAAALDKLELLDAALFDRERPFAVPASYLLDGDGRLAAIYRGRLNLEALFADVAVLDAPPERLRAASLPWPGRWLTKLPDVDPVWMAKQFKDRYPEDVEHYLKLALEEQDGADLRLALAEATDRQGRRQEAVAHLERAVELDPSLGAAHAGLARLLHASGRRGEAVDHYLRAIEIDPADAESHHALGVTLRAAGRLDEAFERLATAARLRPEWPAPLIPMVWMLVTAGPDEARAREAVRLAERAVQLTEARHPVTLDTLAAAYAAAGRLEEAVAAAREALERARASGHEALVAEIAGRLRQYER